jgi:hypothetical protein
MTTRRALLISNPGEQGAQNYCRGVLIDIINYKKHLTSPLGGAWFETEINYLNKPSISQVNNEIYKMSSFDYTLILFSGHGYYSNITSSTWIELNKDEDYDSNKLRMLTNKRTIILDCCREIYPPRPTVMAEAMKKVAKAPLDFERCRKFFNALIEKCLKGIVVGHSCSINETSGDDENNGGYYASSLLRTATNWSENNNSWATYSVVQAHNSAVPLVGTLSGGTQNPYIEKPRSEPYFPFAVKA